MRWQITVKFIKEKISNSFKRFSKKLIYLFYGCWCPKLFSKSAHLGQPLDDIDQICKKFMECQKCNKFSSCNSNRLESYFLSINPLTDEYACESSSQCSSQACACIGEMATELSASILKVLSSNNSLEVSNRDVDSSVCVRNKIGSEKDACCGNSPFWVPYDSRVDECINGEIIRIE